MKSEPHIQRDYTSQSYCNIRTVGSNPTLSAIFSKWLQMIDIV